MNDTMMKKKEVYMRKLMRGIARAKMQAEGVQHINRRPLIREPQTGAVKRAKSYFAQNWRKYAGKAQ